MALLTMLIADDTILDLWGTGPNRPPVDTHHPAVRTHPVTGLRALNVNPGFVTDFAELKGKESGTSLPLLTTKTHKLNVLTADVDKLKEFFDYHIHSADDHLVRWKWEVGSVAMWDNRCTIHRVIPGTYKGSRRGVRTTVFGEKPYFDPSSVSRAQRQKDEISADGTDGDVGRGQVSHAA